MDCEKLYRENKGLLYHFAKRYYWACERDPAVDVDDLIQQGFIGLVQAYQTFDDSKGASFSAWAFFYIRNEMKSAVCLKSSKIHPEIGAISLDAPLDCEGENLSLLDTLIDENAAEAYLSIEQQELCEKIRERVDALENAMQKRAIKRVALDGASQQDVGNELGVSDSYVSALVQNGFDTLSRDPVMQELARIEDETRYHAHKGIQRFNSDWTSVVEDAVIWRTEQKERLEQLFEMTEKMKIGEENFHE